MTHLLAHKLKCNSQRTVWEPLKGQEVKIISVTQHFCFPSSSPNTVDLSFHKLPNTCRHSKPKCRHSSTAIDTTQTLGRDAKTESLFLLETLYFLKNNTYVNYTFHIIYSL